MLTGGTCMLDGMADVGERIFNLPVRIGYPTGVGGLVDVVNSPAFATGVGLVLYGAKEGEFFNVRENQGGMMNKIKSRMGEWFSSHF